MGHSGPASPGSGLNSGLAPRTAGGPAGTHPRRTRPDAVWPGACGWEAVRSYSQTPQTRRPFLIGHVSDRGRGDPAAAPQRLGWAGSWSEGKRRPRATRSHPSTFHVAFPPLGKILFLFQVIALLCGDSLSPYCQNDWAMSPAAEIYRQRKEQIGDSAAIFFLCVSGSQGGQCVYANNGQLLPWAKVTRQ